MMEFNDTVYADYWGLGEENGWEPNGVNGEQEQCMMLNDNTEPISHGRKLNDIFCNNELEFVCKRKIAIVPTLQPTTQPTPSTSISPDPSPSSSSVPVLSLGVVFALALMMLVNFFR
uniref:C-type lectin domain-containing protein n=1 Tax=Ditylenchus dipsaci TaxID=166011 RepID=A0A915DTY3_9BILA